MLTPEQLVATIKLDEAVKARPSREEVREPWATNPMHFAPRIHAGAVATLPKPPRVERWQRWHGPSYEYVCTNVGTYGAVTLERDGIRLERTPECLLSERSNWHFLGYARPTCVEPGQRWQNRSKGVVEVAKVDELWVTMTNGDRYSLAFCRHPSWEYCGMADTASTEKVIKHVATVTGQPKGSVRTAIEDIRERYSPNMLERLGELFDSAKQAPPVFGGVALPIAAPIARAYTTGGSPSEFTVVTAARPNPAAEERRALEATAKRLIDNPPAWAYPKAWMMAVLREVECRVSAAMLAREFSPRFCFYEELRLYQERRSAGQTHDVAKAGLNLPELCDVYARGLDIRAKPLLVRPVGIGRVR